MQLDLSGIAQAPTCLLPTDRKLRISDKIPRFEPTPLAVPGRGRTIPRDIPYFASVCRIYARKSPMKTCFATTLLLLTCLVPSARADLLLDDYDDTASANVGDRTLVGDAEISPPAVVLGADRVVTLPNGSGVAYSYSPGDIPVADGFNAFVIDEVTISPTGVNEELTATVDTAGSGPFSVSLTPTIPGPLTFYFGSSIVGESITSLTIFNTSNDPSVFGEVPRISFDNLTAVAVPEPFSLAFCGLAVAGGGLAYRRRRRGVPHDA